MAQKAALRSRSPLGLAAAGVVLSLSMSTQGRTDETWLASAAFTSDYVLRGLSQTRGDPSLQAGFLYQGNSGLYAGMAAAQVNTDWPEYDVRGARMELDLQAGMTRALGPNWSWELGVTRYIYVDDDRPRDYDYTGIELAIDFRDTLRASVTLLDGVSMVSHAGPVHNQRALAWELALQQPLNERFSLTAGAGYHDLDDLFGTSYTCWDLGATARFGRLTLSFGHYWVSDSARELFGSAIADDRLAFTLVVSL